MKGSITLRYEAILALRREIKVLSIENFTTHSNIRCICIILWFTVDTASALLSSECQEVLLWVTFSLFQYVSVI